MAATAELSSARGVVDTGTILVMSPVADSQILKCLQLTDWVTSPGANSYRRFWVLGDRQADVFHICLQCRRFWVLGDLLADVVSGCWATYKPSRFWVLGDRLANIGSRALRVRQALHLFRVSGCWATYKPI